MENAGVQSGLKTVTGPPQASAVSRALKAVTNVVPNAIAVQMRICAPTK